MFGIDKLLVSDLTLIALPLILILIATVLHLRLKGGRKRHIHGNIEQLQVLRSLLADLQRHRGLSTGLLSGDKSLRAEVTATGDRLDRSIARAQAFDTTHADTWQAIFRQWQTLRNVQGRDAADNLLAHNMIIRDTIFLIEDIYVDEDLSADKEELSYLVCIWHEVVQTAEWSGQARALGTGIAAAQQSSAAQRVRLRFLHQKISDLSEVAFNNLTHRFSDVKKLTTCREAVDRFLLCLESNLLTSEKPDIEAKHYFDQATAAINELFGLVDSALIDLKRVHCDR